MKIKDTKNGKVITLSHALDTRAKLFYLIGYVLWMSIALLLSYKASDDSMVLACIVLVLGLLVSYRMADKALKTEKLKVTEEYLIVQLTGLFSKKTFVYDNKLVSNFRHLKKPELTKHPLEGQSTDYLGFGARQHFANELHGDNRLAFDYNGKTVMFGEHIYSWDFNELYVLLHDITGKDLSATHKHEVASYS